MSNKPMLLMILDGWGTGEDCAGNAITKATPVNFYRLRDQYPATELKCSGKAVGLPAGQMGNSEVGHLNMGAGRIVYQEISRISNAIEDGSFFQNPVLLSAVQAARDGGAAVHLMGLVSDGGVHSHMQHILALLELCKREQVGRVYIHAYLDGRDVGPKSAPQYLQELDQYMKSLGVGKFATLGGRFYGMDRDNRWERVEKAYAALVYGQGNPAPNWAAAIENSYEARVTDEFVEPVVIVDDQGEPIATVQDNDTIIFFNFRADRAREITRSFIDADFDHFQRQRWPRVNYVMMTQYDATIDAAVAFEPQNLKNTLGEVLAQQGLRQLRIAETEKYAHVTFFFNGGIEAPNSNEDRILVPSPTVKTYNMKPEMSAPEVTEKVLEAIDQGGYDVIIMNYANPDMVGHTGILEAAIEAVHVVDECLARVADRVLAQDGTILMTADHGNCETMQCPVSGGPFTAHTTNKVPFILISNHLQKARLREEGALCDIAPTMLELLNIDVPVEMTGTSLILNN